MLFLSPPVTLRVSIYLYSPFLFYLFGREGCGRCHTGSVRLFQEEIWRCWSTSGKKYFVVVIGGGVGVFFCCCRGCHCCFAEAFFIIRVFFMFMCVFVSLWICFLLLKQVEKIRRLALEKSAGEISEDSFLSKKRELLEMEHLRRGAQDEAERRAEVRRNKIRFNYQFCYFLLFDSNTFFCYCFCSEGELFSK